MSTEFCDDYAVALDHLPAALEKSYTTLKDADFSLKNLCYSRIVINRLRAFYCVQHEIKNFLNKKLAQSGADFFVETILFVLKLFNDVENLNLDVCSELAIEQRRGSIRPDISVWRENKLICAVECKTQLGYQRRTWLQQFESREEKLKVIFPDATMFLLVMTSCNWDGFANSKEKLKVGNNPKEDLRVGQKFFCIMDEVWPTSIVKDFEISEILVMPIENLLRKVKELSLSAGST